MEMVAIMHVKKRTASDVDMPMKMESALPIAT